MYKITLISSPAILAGDFLFLPANSDFHPHLAGKTAFTQTYITGKSPTIRKFLVKTKNFITLPLPPVYIAPSSSHEMCCILPSSSVILLILSPPILIINNGCRTEVTEYETK